MSLFEIVAAPFEGSVKVIRSQRAKDFRGFLAVSYLENEMKDFGIPPLVRDFRTRSHKRVLRGLHYQSTPPMGKLIQVTRGSAFIAIVDFRQTSPTFLEHIGLQHKGTDGLQVWIPPGFLLGYQALEELDMQYKTSAYFDDRGDSAIRWNDARINIKWPLDRPILSPRDLTAPTISQYFGATE
jgi:dTDP-4-dehydrorhamnose 3,5-epimerase